MGHKGRGRALAHHSRVHSSSPGRPCRPPPADTNDSSLNYRLQLPTSPVTAASRRTVEKAPTQRHSPTLPRPPGGAPIGSNSSQFIRSESPLRFYALRRGDGWSHGPTLAGGLLRDAIVNSRPALAPGTPLMARPTMGGGSDGAPETAGGFTSARGIKRC